MVNWMKTGIGGLVGVGAGFAIQFIYLKAIEPPSCPSDLICPKCGTPLDPETGSDNPRWLCLNCGYWCWTVPPPWMPMPIWPITVPVCGIIGAFIGSKL